MIDEIEVHDLALIHEARLVLGPGLTVLTGETGAGKTALLFALKLLMGERADSSMVREGADAAEVAGRFFEGPHDTEGFCAVRRLTSDGRSRARVDGSMTSARELGERVRPLVDLCGQHEHQRLLDAASHVEMVDAWAGEAVAPALSAYRAAFAAAREARAEFARVEEAGRTQGSRLEEARFAVERIGEVDPTPGEYEELEELLPRLEHAEVLAGCANDAQEALSGEGAALDALNTAIAGLSRMGSVDAKLQTFADELVGAAIVIEDTASALRRYRDDVDYDPAELARLQERHAALRALLRRFGPQMDDVFRRKAEAEELLSLVNDSEARCAKARAAVDAAEGALYQAARKLKRARNAAGPRFCREVGAQMARLKMGGAELVWEARDLPRDRWTDAGPCACELLYRSGAGLTPRPLKRIASGGELSRVMLACKVVLGRSDGVDTLVFDEVDAGVGGTTARALGAVLADLARTHQVIVVTHLAQVAVLGDVHYVVRKDEGAGEAPTTSLAQVSGEDRVEEIARMLSGDGSRESLEHARALLAESGRL